MGTYQNQILYGTILGGTSIIRPPKGVNYYLSMRGNNLKWLMYKKQLLPNYFEGCKINQYGNTYRVNSRCMETLTEIRSIFYKGHKRKIHMRVLDSLTSVALAVWFLDSGGKSGRGKKNAYINTTRFGKRGTRTIRKYFRSVDMPCNINVDGKREKILFSVKGTEKLMRVIAHDFPSFMYNRI